MKGYIKLAESLAKSNYALTAIGWRDCDINEIATVLEIVYKNRKQPEVITTELNYLYKYHPDTIELEKAERERNCDNFNETTCNCYLPDIKFDEYTCTVERRNRVLLDDERNTPEYNKWRRAVFERDNFTCQKCGQYGGELNAHHIEHFALNKDKRLDIDNGITLCTKCHKKEHRKR